MLVGVVGLFESKERFKMFKENNFEIMYLDKRIAYFKDFKEQKPSLNPPFSSVYVCKDILPKQIIFEQVNKKIESREQKINSKCKYGKEKYDIDCYECIEFKEGRCLGDD